MNKQFLCKFLQASVRIRFLCRLCCRYLLNQLSSLQSNTSEGFDCSFISFKCIRNAAENEKNCSSWFLCDLLKFATCIGYCRNNYSVVNYNRERLVLTTADLQWREAESFNQYGNCTEKFHSYFFSAMESLEIFDALNSLHYF